MAQPVVKASLATLPPELLEYIFPDRRRELEESMEVEHQVYAQARLALKHEWREVRYKYSLDIHFEIPGPHYILQDLRSLSHVCRSLRAYALPLLWDIVHIQTVREMDMLAKAMRDLPYIAPLVRHFVFMWDMNKEWRELSDSPKEHGSFLDMAFIDRVPLWKSLPGRAIDPDFPISSPPVRSGPDGKGEDASIKMPQDFNKCIEEIVAQLPNVEVFGWNSPTAVMPFGAVQALRQASKLRTFSIRFETRNTVHVAPYWELTPQVETLSIDMPYCKDASHYKIRTDIVETDELAEDEITSFELPPPALLDSAEAEQALHTSIVSRMIVAAAKGGRLRHLYGLGSQAVQKPFAVRSLLPGWVGVDHWDWWRHAEHPLKASWFQAAANLRSTLAHASLRLPGPSAKRTRLLTAADVQSLHAFLTANGAVWQGNLRAWVEKPRGPLAIVKLYLPWLEEDAELAQRVTDAWNAVVERGEADKVKCYCKVCSPKSHVRPEDRKLLPTP